VDAGDYVLWRKLEGMMVSEPYARGDANGDRLVNDADLLIMRQNFGNTSGGNFGGVEPTSVPEPASGLLMASAMLMFSGRARRRAALGRK
jgi:hypothetical protein